MSEEQGHHRRMPDPRTPFPVLGAGDMQLGRSGNDLVITPTGGSPTTYPIGDGSLVDNIIAAFGAAGEGRWGWACGDASKPDVLFFHARSQQVFSALHEGMLSELTQLDPTNEPTQIHVGFTSGSRTRKTQHVWEVTALLGWHDACGGVDAGNLYVWLGAFPVNAPGGNGYGLDHANQDREITLAYQLPAPTT